MTRRASPSPKPARPVRSADLPPASIPATPSPAERPPAVESQTVAAYGRSITISKGDPMWPALTALRGSFSRRPLSDTDIERLYSILDEGQKQEIEEIGRVARELGRGAAEKLNRLFWADFLNDRADAPTGDTTMDENALIALTRIAAALEGIAGHLETFCQPVNAVNDTLAKVNESLGKVEDAIRTKPV